MTRRTDIKVNWERLALNIRAAGVPLVKASKQIGEHHGFVAQLARGEVLEPKFSQGMALLNLHVDVCGEEKTAGLLG